MANAGFVCFAGIVEIDNEAFCIIRCGVHEALNVAEEEMILICLAKLEPVIPDWFNLKDLADSVNAECNRKVSSKHVSGVLHRLGLVRHKKYQGYTLVYAPKELIEESAKRIGVHVSDLQTPQSLPTPEEWKEVFKG